MKLPRFVALALLVGSSFAATGVTPNKTELEAMYDKAFREFDANHYDAALKALDAIDARKPDLAESQNLRGVVLMRKGEYDNAEKALRKALAIEPKFWNANFNLAEISFLKKDWTEARNRFEALVAGNSEEMKGETSLLIQYKILLTFVLQGKENMVDWIVNKFDGEKNSPALYYSNAAIALQHNNRKEAKEWLDAAEKHYPAPLNKLFAESFYEIGWLQKPEGETRAAIEVTSTAEHAARMKADAQANFERAERALQRRDLPAAVRFLNLADEGEPDQAKSLNLRGEILMAQEKFDQAEDAFDKAIAADPKFEEAQYNLAQISFKKKDYGKSRERLEKLFAETPGGHENQAAQLIKYKIFMTLLLEGNDPQAQQMMDQFKFTGDTPALYYAQAAWEFTHDNPDKGNDWVKSARKIYSPALNIVFADTLYDLGWLKRASEASLATTALAQANARPAGPAPAMRFGESKSVQAPVQAESPAQVAAATAAPPVEVANPSPATAEAAPVEAKASVATGASSPAPLQGSAALVAGKASAPPIPKPTPGLKAAAPIAQTTAFISKLPQPATAAGSSAVTPAATAVAANRVREHSQLAFAELVDHVSEPRTLLLLLAGIGILGWLVAQQLRRQPAGVHSSALPLTGPRFGRPVSVNERRLCDENVDGGPPKLSLKLTATGSPGLKTVLPPDVAGAQIGIHSSGIAPDEERQTARKTGSVPPSTPPPAAKSPPAKIPLAANQSAQPDDYAVAPKTPLRDDKEVSLAAFAKPSVAATSTAPAFVAAPQMPMAEAKKPVLPAEEEEPWVSTDKKFLVDQEEPVGQGQPVPHLIPSAQDVEPKPALAESQEKPLEQRPTRIEPESAAIAAIAGKDSPQPPVPAPTFVAKTIASNPPASVARELTALKSEPPMVPEQAPTRLEPETAAIVALAVRASP